MFTFPGIVTGTNHLKENKNPVLVPLIPNLRDRGEMLLKYKNHQLV